MSALDVAQATLQGTYDAFDRCTDLADYVATQITERPCTLQLQAGLVDDFFSSVPDEDMYLFDPQQGMREQLARAKELIEEARQLIISVHQEV